LRNVFAARRGFEKEGVFQRNQHLILLKTPDYLLDLRGGFLGASRKSRSSDLPSNRH